MLIFIIEQGVYVKFFYFISSGTNLVQVLPYYPILIFPKPEH